MTARLIRFLGVTCALLLALPPAWCCWTPHLTLAAQGESTPAPCCHKGAAPNLPLPPLPPERCPCYDRQTIPTAGPEKGAVNPPLAVGPVAAVSETPRAGPALDFVPTSPPFSRPLHLLRCVWLC